MFALTGRLPSEIFCERPAPLENGYLEQGAADRPLHAFNATAQYRCAAGFVMQGGPGRRRCAVTGRWTGAMPRCQREWDTGILQVIRVHGRPMIQGSNTLS